MDPFKITAFCLIVIFIAIYLSKNLNKWSLDYQNYMHYQAKKVFGSDDGWTGAWGKFLSKASIIFLSLMFIVLIYAAIFGSAQ
jgi:preprotein translocase subunit SecG